MAIAKRTACRPPLHGFIGPYIEQKTWFDDFHWQPASTSGTVNTYYSLYDAVNLNARMVFVPGFSCPTAATQVMVAGGAGDPNHAAYARWRGNYVCNWGNTGYGQQPLPAASGGTVAFSGLPFTFVQNICLSDIRDGTSNTLMLSEVLSTSFQNGWADYTGPLGDTMIGEGGQAFETWLTPNSTAAEVVDRQCPGTSPIPGSSPPAYAWAIPNEPCQGAAGGPIYNATTLAGFPTEYCAARSNHPGGVNAAPCDGSVRFFSNFVSWNIWQALGTTCGNEVFTMP